jgi:hypothetical protein
MPTDPRIDPLRFAYWVPNLSGGLVTLDPGAVPKGSRRNPNPSAGLTDTQHLAHVGG